MLCMGLGRKIAERVRAKSWAASFAVSLYDANVLIVGAGGITEELIKLLAPFRSHITVVRNQTTPMPGANRTAGLAELHALLPEADFVILACALTPATRGLFDSTAFAAMKPEAYLVNIARGPVVVTNDLLNALKSGQIAGAGIDVTDPEPLPDGHPAWDEPNLIITPHTADTKVMVKRLFSIRLRENGSAYLGAGDWVGVVDPALGY
jgi:phosphoglycerate dehydrogenase-like enzyme